MTGFPYRAPSIRETASGLGRCEGPVIGQAGALLVVSMSTGYVYEISAGDVQVRAATLGSPNGLAEAADRRLYVAQMGIRSHVTSPPPLAGGVQVVEPDGTVEWLTQDPIAPNDLCFGPDGLLYVTDPTRQPARDDGRIWCCDPVSRETTLLVSVDWFPNGIGFGPEDDALYVASTSHGSIERFPLTATGLGRPERFATLPYGVPDGFAFDREGRLVVAAIRLDVETGASGPAEDAVGELQTFDRNGLLLDRLRIGPSHLYTNLALDRDGSAHVTETAGGTVVRVDGYFDPGLPLHPFRA
jgi:gluconolactonase